MSLVLDVARALVWLAPASRAKNATLRALGHDVHPAATVRPNLVWRVREVHAGPGASINRYNSLRHLRRVSLGEHASIGRFNAVSANPAFAPNPGSGVLALEDHATITSRHRFDCSATVTIRAFAMVAGHESSVMTHAIDLAINAQRARPIEIGERSFVGARCLMLGGATLPGRSVLGAGAVLLPGRGGDAPGLFAGVPARRVGDVSADAWFDRLATATRRVVIPADDGGERLADF